MVKIYWVEQKKKGRLGMMARPRGGEWLEDEMIELKNNQVKQVVSLLEIEEAKELELSREKQECEKQDIKFLSYPIKDRHVPDSMKDTVEIGLQINHSLEIGNSVVLHCRQGIGRTGLLTSVVLLQQKYSLDYILSYLTNIRGCCVPETSLQSDWLVRVNQYISVFQ